MASKTLPVLRIGTRGSALALVQAEMVESALAAAHPGIGLERVVVKTIGDRRTDLRFSEFGAGGEGIVDKGIFTKELEEALEQGLVDLAVHSLKDVPTELGEGFRIEAVLPRAPIEDVLVARRGAAGAEQGGIEGLPERARVGTSSVRRIRLLQHLRPDLRPVEIRGNVPTRVRKLQDESESLDAILLARAGLERLGILGAEPDLEYTVLDPAAFPPAAAQGAVGIEIYERAHPEVAALLKAIHCRDTGDRVTLERAFLAALGAGCQTPVGMVTELLEGDRISLRARVFPDDPEGSDPVLEGEVTGPRDASEPLAAELLSKLTPATS